MASDRYFDDYRAGTVEEYGGITVSEEEILEFARRYDPQPFHIDPEAARRSHYGGLIASGWHTSALMMRLLTEHYLGESSLGSPGIDELRWPAPVRPGDTLSLRVAIIETRPSRSKPDRGILRTKIEVLNQHGTVVLSALAVNLIAVRP